MHTYIHIITMWYVMWDLGLVLKIKLKLKNVYLPMSNSQGMAGELIIML